MTRIIAVVSGKGGVGKTTFVANLGAALAGMGKNVIVLDANLTTPNLGIHLGIPLFPITLHDVLKGRANIRDAIYDHESGLKVIPAGISLRDLRGVDSSSLPNALLDLLGAADIVILDAAAGLGREALAAMEAADEMIVITNPDLPAVTDALKAVKLAEQLGTKTLGVVVNRVKGQKHEMRREEILGMLDDISLLAEVPEDINVQKAIAARVPVIHHKPNAQASHAIRRTAAALVGRSYFIDKPWHQRLFGFLR
ncbi:MAG: P-loop NTPase [Candidatus Aenigmarchaeota archaeon]|nr:P-loop NTPase [Candidatus Aenigmarchaeota archaeon]